MPENIHTSPTEDIGYKIPYPPVHMLIVHIYTYNIRKKISAPIQMTEISLVLLILIFIILMAMHKDKLMYPFQER